MATRRRRREAPTGREGECRPSRQITQSGSRHSNSAKVELARSDHSNRELVSWKERGRGERKEGKKLSRECIALLKREECLARLASLSATTTIIMMAMGAARSFVPVFSFVLFLPLSLHSTPPIVYFPPSTWSPFFRPEEEAPPRPI